ncbi:MAG: HD domain-containing phosphohydrolase [Solirubrobacteraceae bacterium]
MSELGDAAAVLPVTEPRTATDQVSDPRAGGQADRLLEDSWTKRTRRSGRREMIVEGAAAALFLGLAIPLALPTLTTHLPDLELVSLLVILYAVVAGTIGFPIGAGYLVPTYAILVPMLLLLPPAIVPLLAATAGVLAALGRLAMRRGQPEHVLFAIPNAWYAVGPAVVLMVAGSNHGSLATAGIYLAAFMAGCLVDLVTSTLRESAALMIAPQIQLRVTAQVWVIDACIAPLGLLLAVAARHDHAAVLMVLPLGMLLLVLQRDRTQRIVQAHERLELAITDPLTRLGNRRKLSADLVERMQTASRARPLVLMVFDLDGFKAYNDTFGHMAGDALLARMGRKLEEVVAPAGAAYRLGGDEFCVVLDAQPEDVPAAMALVTDALREDGETFSIAASGGAVLLPHEANTAEYGLQLADERMYQRKQKRRPSAAREQTRDVLVRIMQAKQPGLTDHTSQVSRLAVTVARRLGVDAEQIDELARAADLHDIGKVGIPDAILEKPGSLDPAEWELIRQHTLLGERILSAAPALRPVARIVRSSHERWDGDGYPDGLVGEAIPLAARIVAVCDAYDAMISDRCYRPARSPGFARDELLREAGRQFDPTVVTAVLEVLDELERKAAPRCESPSRSMGPRIQPLVRSPSPV